MTKILDEDKYFITNDLSVAAALSLWFLIANIDRTNPQKVAFSFIDSPKLREVIRKFWSNELKVEPKAYFQSIKLLKNRIYQE